MQIVANNYSTSKKRLTEEEIKQRVLEVVKSYDKIVADKVYEFQLFTNLLCSFFLLCFSFDFGHVIGVVCLCSRLCLCKNYLLEIENSLLAAKSKGI